MVTELMKHPVQFTVAADPEVCYDLVQGHILKVNNFYRKIRQFQRILGTQQN